jgi:hypothetical protein
MAGRADDHYQHGEDRDAVRTIGARRADRRPRMRETDVRERRTTVSDTAAGKRGNGRRNA